MGRLKAFVFSGAIASILAGCGDDTSLGASPDCLDCAFDAGSLITADAAIHADAANTIVSDASAEGGATLDATLSDGDAVNPNELDASVDAALATLDASADSANRGDAEVTDAASPDANITDGTDASDAAAAEASADANDCVAPSNETPLVATDEGLPADGLVLWVRGDHGVSKNGFGSVCAWADQSTRGARLIPSSTEPQWVDASLGGRPAIHFDAVGEDLYTPDVLGIDAASGRTMIAVISLVDAAGRFEPILQGASGSGGEYIGLEANTWDTQGGLDGFYVTNNSYDAVAATSTAPTLLVLSLSDTTLGGDVVSATQYRVNGSAEAPTLRAGSGQFQPFTDANFTSVGVVSSTPTPGMPYGNGFVAEAIVYDRALSSDELTAVETALEARYGI